MKNTLVLGASENPARYSNMAIQRLNAYGHKVWAIGLKEGSVGGTTISKDFPSDALIDTVTLYMNPQNQEGYYDKILALQPKRIIFNPGTENPELVQLAKAKGIETEEACTLVMLGTGAF